MNEFTLSFLLRTDKEKLANRNRRNKGKTERKLALDCQLLTLGVFGLLKERKVTTTRSHAHIFILVCAWARHLLGF